MGFGSGRRRWPAGVPLRLLLAVLLAVLLAAPAVAAPAGAAGLAPAAGSVPFGSVEELRVLPSGEVLVRGWAVDDDAPTTPLQIVLKEGSTAYAQALADQPRDDVAAAHPEAGPAHGFEFTLPVGEGRHPVCIYAINAGPGDANPSLGCREVIARTPYGFVEIAARFPEAIRVRGWAADSDSPQPSAVSVSVGETVHGPFVADRARPDVTATWGAGPVTGFDVALPLPPPDTYQLCVTALGVGPGGDASLGCRPVVVSHAPLGGLDVLRGGDGFVRLIGWALDGDGTDPVHIHVTTNGQLSHDVVAQVGRPDVAAAHPGSGADHGFAFDVAMPAGDHTMCAFAVNVGPGPENVLLGCASVAVVPPGSGSGRRIVYHNAGQRVWIVDADGTVARSYFVSGRYNDPPPGSYRVYGWSRYAGSGSATMEYFVAFHPAGLGYGFHTIPVNASGAPLQSEAELGQFRSAGCVRQAWDDAVFLWNWTRMDDPVIVI